MILALIFFLTADAFGQGAAPEYEIKGAFIYNFTKFIEWPPIPKAENIFSLCLYGKDPFASDFKTKLQQKTVKNKPVRIKLARAPADLKGCDIVYMPTTNAEEIRSALTQIKSEPVLTIGDISDFTNLGGIIRFFSEAGKIRFEINLKASKLAKLEISSQVLKLAKIKNGT